MYQCVIQAGFGMSWAVAPSVQAAVSLWVRRRLETPVLLTQATPPPGSPCCPAHILAYENAHIAFVYLLTHILANLMKNLFIPPTFKGIAQEL